MFVTARRETRGRGWRAKAHRVRQCSCSGGLPSRRSSIEHVETSLEFADMELAFDSRETRLDAEVLGERVEEAGAPLVLGEGLIDCEVHLATLDHFTGFNLVPCVAERREDSVLRLVDENVSIRQIENARPSVVAGAVPSRVPELPANLEVCGRLACSGRHRQQQSIVALKCDRPLLRDGMRIAVPSGSLQHRDDALPAGIRFGQHDRSAESLALQFEACPLRACGLCVKAS